jgi:hypothetical protein
MRRAGELGSSTSTTPAPSSPQVPSRRLRAVVHSGEHGELVLTVMIAGEE